MVARKVDLQARNQTLQYAIGLQGLLISSERTRHRDQEGSGEHTGVITFLKSFKKPLKGAQ